MADTNPHLGESSIFPSILSELIARMTEALTIAPISIKLDGTNYTLWSQVVEIYVAGKDKLGYINDDLPQPSTTDPSFRRWRTENATVKGWLIGSMDPSLIGNFIRFSMAKQVWDVIATTYFDGSDATQVYELRQQVARLRQGSGYLEKYYNDLQGLWREIDFRHPNPMQCPADIQYFNNMLQEDRVYTFLDDLDDKLDNIRSDVLQLKPFPIIEQAYAHVRREAMRQAVMTANDGEEAIEARQRDGNGNDGEASKNAANGTGKVAIASVESQLSLIPTTTVDLDTYHMTYDASDFSERSSPRRTSIANANGDISVDILTKEIIGRGTKNGGFYYMEDFGIGQANHTRSSSDRNKANILLWHRRLGHPSFGYLKLVFPALFSDLSNLAFKCKTCILAKSHRMPFEFIHSDVWGPSPKSTISGFDVFSVFCSFREMVKTQYSATIRILRSNNGGKYMHRDFKNYFSRHGLIHETTCPQTPQQKGIAKRKNLHILETARAILLGAHVPNHFWTDAVTTVVHLINRMSSKVLKFKTPLQALSTVISLPTALMLPPQVFGCVAFIHLHKNQCTKLDLCAVQCLFLGYGLHQKGYRCYDPSNHRTYVTMDVTFLESETFYSPTTSTSTLQGVPQNEELNWLRFDWEPVVSVSNTEPDVDTEPGVLPLVTEEQQPQQSIVSPHPTVSKDPSPKNILEVSSLNTPSTPVLTNDAHVGYELPYRHNRGKPPDRYSPTIEDRRLKYPIANYVSTKTLPEPLKTFSYALSSCQVPTSVEEAMKDPRWVQAMKEEMEALLKNKTRILIYIYIYMDIPSGYVANTKGNIVCKLQRTLYGLKQSPRAWFGRFSTAMKKYGFQQSNSDHTLFLKHRQGKLTALIVYVDNMIITGDDSEEIARLQEQLASKFEMKNLRGLKYFLGIEVSRSKRGIFLCQRKYILDLLTEVGLLDCKPTETSIILNHKLGEYPKLVGKLIYLSHTRLDIAYVVSMVSQFMHCPSEDHMSVVMQILRYLKSSLGKGLMFSKIDHLRVEGYTDADWAGNITDRKSTSGYFTFVGGKLVTWRSKKQKVVALSSAEAEFRGMAKGLCELLWLRRLLTEIGFDPDSEMKLFCDNKAAIDISHNHIYCERKIFHHSLDKLGLIDIYVPT
ncbi:hypothetical protein AAG906_016251 [Vitis piasezkii]